MHVCAYPGCGAATRHTSAKLCLEHSATHKRCARCHETLALENFSPSKPAYCRECNKLATYAWKAEHPQPTPSSRRRVRDASRRWQNDTAATAERSGQQWCGWELELAADPSRTSRDVAMLTGRTWRAVRHIREALRFDPRMIERAGLGDVL